MTNFKKFFLQLQGGFGDTFLIFSIVIPLISILNLNPQRIFLGFGLSYIFSSLFYKIPFPVQPLKAVSMYAIIYGFSQNEIFLTSLIFSLIFFIFFIFASTFEKILKKIPLIIVAGIQTSIGAFFIYKGIQFIFLLLNNFWINLSFLKYIEFFLIIFSIFLLFPLQR
ncbi:MAG: putative sulfate/molybdate transporter, partial [Candidatus Ratteibacteria bacterium]